MKFIINIYPPQPCTVVQEFIFGGKSYLLENFFFWPHSVFGKDSSFKNAIFLECLHMCSPQTLENEKINFLPEIDN